MDDQGTEMVSFQLVAAAGEARSLAFEALEKAKARLRANVSFELTMELLFLTIQENT